MNITDIDDKIIKRARQNYLVQQYIDEQKASPNVTKVTNDLKAAFLEWIADQREVVANLAAKAAAGDVDSLDELAEETFKLDGVLKEEAIFIDMATRANVNVINDLISIGRGVLGESIDKVRGSSVTDHSIFQAHAYKYEAEFHEDMRSLGVRDADALTRVSEYVPDIIRYVEKIIENKFGYEAVGAAADTDRKNGSGRSVYFNTRNFIREGHAYGKLAPWSVGNASLLAGGEGSLAARDGKEKLNDEDFALWKKSKAGEPSWPSPWGPGRPGWHIECSAMAGDLLGANFDIHAGGEDLRFPHRNHPHLP
jgi:cysteinyl-tRNA synthetase